MAVIHGNLLYHMKKLISNKKYKGYNIILNQSNDQKPVPRGYFPVYVGEEHKKYVIPISCLSSTRFQALLNEFESEIEASKPITLPCSTMVFETELNLVKTEKGIY